jgi:hypothetical protein
MISQKATIKDIYKRNELLNNELINARKNIEDYSKNITIVEEDLQEKLNEIHQLEKSLKYEVNNNNKLLKHLNLTSKEANNPEIDLEVRSIPNIKYEHSDFYKEAVKLKRDERYSDAIRLYYKQMISFNDSSTTILKSIFKVAYLNSDYKLAQSCILAIAHQNLNYSKYMFEKQDSELSQRDRTWFRILDKALINFPNLKTELSIEGIPTYYVNLITYFDVLWWNRITGIATNEIQISNKAELLNSFKSSISNNTFPTSDLQVSYNHAYEEFVYGKSYITEIKRLSLKVDSFLIDSLQVISIYGIKKQIENNYV